MRGRFLIRSRRVLEDFCRFRNALSLWSTLFVSYYHVLRYARPCCLTERICIFLFRVSVRCQLVEKCIHFRTSSPRHGVQSQRPVKTSKRIKLFSQYPRTSVKFTVKWHDVNSFSKSIILFLSCRQNETLFECYCRRVRYVRFLLFPPYRANVPTTNNWPTLLQRCSTED